MITAISYLVLAAHDGLLGDGSYEANVEFVHSIGEECSIPDCGCHYEEGGSKEVWESEEMGKCSRTIAQEHCDIHHEEQPW